MVQSGDRGQNAANLRGGEDDGEFGLGIGPDQFDFMRPGALEGFLPEHLDGAQGLGARLTGDFLVVFEMDEVLTDFLDGDPLRRPVVKLRQMTHAGQIRVLGARLDGQKLQVIGEGNKDGVRGTFFICMGLVS